MQKDFKGRLQAVEGRGLVGVTVRLSINNLHMLQEFGMWCAHNDAPTGLTNFLKNVTSVLQEEGDGILFEDHTCEE